MRCKQPKQQLACLYGGYVLYSRSEYPAALISCRKTSSTRHDLTATRNPLHSPTHCISTRSDYRGCCWLTLSRARWRKVSCSARAASRQVLTASGSWSTMERSTSSAFALLESNSRLASYSMDPAQSGCPNEPGAADEHVGHCAGEHWWLEVGHDSCQGQAACAEGAYTASVYMVEQAPHNILTAAACLLWRVPHVC